MDAFKALIGRDFDFNKIIPMPPELEADTLGDTGCKVMVVLDPNTMLCHKASGEHGGRSIFEVVNAHFNPADDIISLTQAVIDGYKPCEECINIGIRNNTLGQGLDFSLEESIRRFKEYGTDNWYDWKIKHWGTKWNSSDVQADFMEDRATFFFTTAWSPPEPIYHALVDKFPNLDIKWHYDEPGCNFSGDFDTGEQYEYQCECGESHCPYCFPDTYDDEID